MFEFAISYNYDDWQTLRCGSKVSLESKKSTKLRHWTTGRAYKANSGSS